MNPQSAPPRSRTRDHWIGFTAGLGVIALLCGVVGWQRSPVVPNEMLLRDSVEQVSVDSMRVLSLRVPRDGLLEIEATTPEGQPFSVYLTARPGTQPSRPSELRLFSSFTAERVGHYRRSAHVARGEYNLTLIKSQSVAHSPDVPTRVRARLKT